MRNWQEKKEKKHVMLRPVTKWTKQPVLFLTGCHSFYNIESLSVMFGQELLEMSEPTHPIEENRLVLEPAIDKAISVLDLRQAGGEKICFEPALADEKIPEKLAIIVLLAHEDQLCWCAHQTQHFFEIASPGDLQVDDELAKKMLGREGFNKKQCEEIIKFCSKDLGLIAFFIARKRRFQHISTQQVKKHMLHSLSHLYVKEFKKKERRENCRLQHLFSLNNRDVDCLFEDRVGAQGIIHRLVTMGLIIEKDWGSYLCTPLLHAILDKERYVLFTYEERKAFQSEEIRFLCQRDQSSYPLHLAMQSEELPEIEALLSRFIMSSSEISEGDKVKKIYQMGKRSKLETLSIFQVIALIHQTYQGNSQQKYRLTDELLENWQEIEGKNEGIYAGVSLLVFVSLLEQGKVEQAKVFFENHVINYGYSEYGYYSVAKMMEHHLKMLLGETRAKNKEYIFHKNTVMGLQGGHVWLSIVKLFLEQDLLDFSLDEKEHDHFLREILSATPKASAQHFLYQIFRRTHEVHTTLYAREFSNEVLYLQQRIDNSHNLRIKVRGYFLLTIEHLLDGKVNMAWGQVDEMLYYSKISGNQLQYFQALLLKTYVSFLKNRIEYAWQLIQTMETLPFSTLQPYEIIILRIKAQMLIDEKSYKQSTVCFDKILSYMKKNEYDLGIIDAHCHLLLLEKLTNQSPMSMDQRILDVKTYVKEEDVQPLFDQYLKISPILFALFRSVDKNRKIKMLIDTPVPADSIYVQLFSEFKIEYGNRYLTEDQWKTRKVKGILQYLILQPKRRVPRIELVQTFWPEMSDDTQAAANLRVALSLLGKTLGEIDLRHILQRNRQRVWLNLPPDISIDYLDARQSYEEGKQYYKENEYNLSEKKLLVAEKQWEQPFLIAQKKEPWAIEEKEKLARRLESCRYYLLHIAMENQQYAKSVLYCKKILSKNRYREDIYRILIATLKRQGRLGEAVQIFKEYKQLLKEELKIHPSQGMLAMESSLNETLY